MVQLILLESRRWFSDQPVSINKCMDDAIVLLLYSFSMTSKLEEIVTNLAELLSPQRCSRGPFFPVHDGDGSGFISDAFQPPWTCENCRPVDICAKLDETLALSHQ